MTTFAFDFEWILAAPSSDKLSQATMAELGIRIDEHSVTAVLDRRARSYRDRVVVPLLPLAEWLVANWWFLRHEADVENPVLRRPGFAERHDLRHGGDGFFLPSLTIVPIGDRARLSAEAWRPTHGTVEFLKTCTRTIDRAPLEAELRSIIDAVIERLSTSETRAQALQRDWEAINRIDEDELAFCKASALLGLDPFEVDDRTADMIANLWETTIPSLREDLFACADVGNADAVAAWVRGSLARLSAIQSGDGWTTLRHDVGEPAGSAPWERGYDLARRARDRIRSNRGRFEFEGAWAIGSQEIDMPSDRLDAIVAHSTPSCLVRARSKAGRRFLFARAVGEFLAGYGDGPSLLSSLSTERQAESRAFAAEFLVPSVALRAELGRTLGYVDADTVDRLATKFDVGTRVISHQIENHDLGTIIDIM